MRADIPERGEAPGGSAGRVAGWLAAERERWALWLPVGIGAGVAGYFALPFEPDNAPGLIALAVALGLGCLGLRMLRAQGRGEALVICAFLIGAPAVGFSAAKYQSDAAAAPVILKRLGPVKVMGRIEMVEPALKGPRVTIAVYAIDRLEAAATPRRVRLRLRPRLLADGERDLVPGAGITILAMLLPPPGPAVPGGFDFARAAWFDGIGGVGFALRAPEIAPPGAPVPEGAGGPMEKFFTAVAGLRRQIFSRITGILPGASGGIAAALMTGERGAIPEPTLEAVRAAGLAHLLAISGLHIGLVTGILFFGLRALLALIPRLALNWPIKKWAAGAALFGALAYLLLTGATVPTQRAFLMAALVLGAVMVDRAALNMRLVAFAAVAVLLFSPESLTGPSFQMSFAAVGALIAGYEVLRRPLSRLAGKRGIGRRVLVYVAGVGLTTLIAGLATAPFALYHFNRFAVFGLAANLGAVPLTAFWIMPAATLAYLLMPFGLEAWALEPMGWGIDAVIAIADTIARQPGASFYVPTLPVWGLVLIALGGLWLILWRRPWRLAGLAGVAAGLASLAFVPPPDLLISGDGHTLAVRKADGTLVFAGGKGSKFQRQVWLRRSGLAAEQAPVRNRHRRRSSGLSALKDRGALSCDPLACVAHIRGRMVSVIHNPAAAREDCPQADLVIALTTLYRFPCRGPAHIITRLRLARAGTHAVWFADDGTIRVETVAGRRGRRPWTGPGGGRSR